VFGSPPRYPTFVWGGMRVEGQWVEQQGPPRRFTWNGLVVPEAEEDDSEDILFKSLISV